MTEYQAAIGLTQLKRLDEHTTLRNANAKYLKSKISAIPGILPYRLYDQVTRASFHFFPFRYIKEEFSNLSRDQFLRALNAEGIPAFSGYRGLLFSMPYLNDAFQSKNYQLMYPKKMLHFENFVEQNQCPESERLSNETGIWISQSLLLGTNSDMDDIFNAIEKIHANSAKIKASF
jgi:dTDP-4-amino-4,6-dideoxygalactose transaminase